MKDLFDAFKFDIDDAGGKKPKTVFDPTQEQIICKDLIVDNDLVKINAIAGSGKTSTLVYCSENIVTKSLYLAFNKSMADEAKGKFPNHVTCMTTHSLAYRAIGNRYQHKLKRPSGKYVNVAAAGTEIARYYSLPDVAVSEDTFIGKNFLGLIVKDTVTKFEHSADERLKLRHIPTHHIKDIEKRYSGVNIDSIKKFIHRYAEMLWESRTDILSEVLCTHDTYLKLYQLSSPDLSDYDVIYLDESQDTNDCVLDLFMAQKDNCKLVLVGDDRQSIYQWRGSINAMAKVQCAEGTLSKSFRFGEELAKVARAVLKNEVQIHGLETLDTKVGVDAVDFDKPYTLLFRTNLNLIFKAIEMVSNGESVNVKLDLYDFIKMLQSAKELFKNNMKGVKHEDILPFNTWDSLKEEANHDAELNRIVKLVEDNSVDRVIDTLKTHRPQPNAQVTLTTAHKAKGLEWDQVVLAEDFPSNYNSEGVFVGLAESEENLLYVACTRATKALQYNTTVDECIQLYK